MTLYKTALRKGKKWYQKLAISRFSGIAITNAWVVYKKLTGKSMKLKAFKESIVLSLLQIPNLKPYDPKPKRVKHLLLEKLNEEGKKVMRRCRKWYEKLANKQSRLEAGRKAKNVFTYCSGCPGKIYFCLSCFREFHG